MAQSFVNKGFPSVSTRPNQVRYLISILCIVFSAACVFSLHGHLSPWRFARQSGTFAYYLIAGLCLVFGEACSSRNAVYVYCWMMFGGIVLVVSNATADLFFLYSDAGDAVKGCPECVHLICAVYAVRGLILIVFSLYSPLLVLETVARFGKSESRREDIPQAIQESEAALQCTA